LVSVIIVAAGEGERFKSTIPKLFLKLGDKPIIVHSLLAFLEKSLIDEVILVVHPEEVERTNKVCSDFSIKIDKVITGGKRRQDSVSCGLRQISPQTNIVLVHDGARPLVDEKLIEQVIREAKVSGAVVPGIPCEDTVKEIEKDEVIKTYNRNLLWSIQTPQGFKKDVILSAYEKAQVAHSYGTDDAQLVEKMGHPVKIIYGNKENIKITRPVDLVLAEAILEKRLTG